MSEFSEWFHNILEEAEIIDTRYPIKGMHVWQPQGFQIRKHTLNLIREILDEDHEEVLFPLLIPEDELAKEAIHVKGFEDEVYWITHGGLTPLKKKLALRPTSETAMYPLFALWVRSHSDLPKRFYQVVNTFRYETKHTRPLIRVREITTFKEAHTIHADQMDADKQVEQAIQIYSKFFEGLGVPYVVTRRPDWDKFPGADYTMAFDTLMPDGKTLQIGTVHNLGQTFARTFEINDIQIIAEFHMSRHIAHHRECRHRNCAHANRKPVQSVCQVDAVRCSRNNQNHHQNIEDAEIEHDIF